MGGNLENRILMVAAQIFSDLPRNQNPLCMAVLLQKKSRQTPKHHLKANLVHHKQIPSLAQLRNLMSVMNDQKISIHSALYLENLLVIKVSQISPKSLSTHSVLFLARNPTKKTSQEKSKPSAASQSKKMLTSSSLLDQ